MESVTTFNQQEETIINTLYNKSKSKFLWCTIALLIGGFLMLKIFELVPAEFFGRRANGYKGPLIDSMGYTKPIIVILLFMSYIFIVIINETKVFKLKKDVKEKVKITANLKVTSVKNLSDSDLRELRSLGVTNTSDLIFEPNEFKIKVYPFNKFELPAYLDAKELYLEMAKYSKTEFVREIIV